MNALVAGGAALAVLAVIVIAGGWRLVVLDRDLTRMDEELTRLQDELHSTRQHLRASQDRQRDILIMTREHRNYLQWLQPWVSYWVELSQQRGR